MFGLNLFLCKISFGIINILFFVRISHVYVHDTLFTFPQSLYQIILVFGQAG